MQTNEDIVARFFMALDALYSCGKIRTMRSFERDLGVNHGSFYTQKKRPDYYILKPYWLAHLVSRYDISAEWLLTGRGTMFK